MSGSASRLHGGDVGAVLEVEAVAMARAISSGAGLVYLGIEDKAGRAVGDTFDAVRLLQAVVRACDAMGIDVDAVLAGDDSDRAARARLR